MKLFNSTAFVLGLLFFVSQVFSYLLYNDLTKKGKGGSGEPIGTITFKQNTIERKFDESVVWDNVDQKTPVMNKDTIRTLENSDAVLTLANGTQIKLSENSMIYLDFSQKKLNIDFSYGSIAAEKGESQEGLSIKSSGKEIEVESGNAKLSKQGEDNLSMVMEKGEAKITVDGKEQKIKNNETADLKGDKVEIKPLNLILQSPSNNKFYSSSGGNTNVDFQWSSVDSRDGVNFEISKDSSYTKVIKKINGLKETGTTVALQGGGSYYWRISAKNSGNNKIEYSETRKINFIEETPIRILTPSDNKIFYYTKEIPLIPIRWSKNDNAISYKLELSRTSDFSSTIKSVDSLENSVSMELPVKGKYFVKITTRPGIADIAPSTSNIVSFNIEEKSIPDPPELLSPSPGSSLSLELFIKGKANFNWRDNKEFSGYSLQIAKDREFKTLVFTQSLKGNYLPVKLSESTGDYFWRVKGQLADGRESTFSNPGGFRVSEPEPIKLSAPETNSEIDMPEDGYLTFRWQRPESSGFFKLEISKSSDFSGVTFSGDGTGYSQKAQFQNEGKYFWRVRQFSSDGTEINKSEVREFSLLAAPLAILGSPASGFSWNLGEKEETNFNWDRNDKAISYDFIIWDKSRGGTRTIFQKEVKDNYFVFNEITRLQEGPYQWGVSIVYKSGDGRILKSPPARKEFNVIIPKTEEPLAKLTSPVNSSEYMQFTSAEIPFKWERSDKSIYYELSIFDSKTKKQIFQKQLPDNELSFQIPETLQEGSYRAELSIHYKTWDGKVLKSSPSFLNFIIKFPEVIAPEFRLKSPQEGETFELKDNLELSFNWENADKAEGYNFELIEQLAQGKIKTILTKDRIQETSLTFRETKNLKVGKYTWRVSVYYKDKQGRILKSPFQKSNFQLVEEEEQIELPKLNENKKIYVE